MVLLDQCHTEINPASLDSAFCATDDLACSFENGQDLVLIGASSAFMHQGVGKVVSQRNCTAENSEFVNASILHHLKSRGSLDPFWISLNANVLNKNEF